MSKAEIIAGLALLSPEDLAEVQAKLDELAAKAWQDRGESSEADKAVPTLYERFANIIGIAEGLPEDMAENHDHYIHGTPKRTAR